ncbi:hypothetical protein AMK59_6486 [Oryctes borbonicus]|uniref:Enoyl reductase (ER) domain-containing protein n=1 Tax=Oryctes borbonicus TaxID=1629725 RepID=A0A0T6AZH6_9SCAR|nr:hypothetical protein AMK59_6486 [Oryctes borbonicus]
MDEVVFRTSQKVDDIQFHIKLAADEGKNVILHFSEKVKGMMFSFFNNPKYSHLLQLLKNAGAVVLGLHRECKEYIIVHSKSLLRCLLKLLGKNFSTRDILIGSAGLIIGGVIGFVLSYAIPRNQNVLRCMQAIQCIRYSGIEAVVLVEDALGNRECGKNEVLVNVKAASLNTVDLAICKGYGSLIRKAMAKVYKNSYELPITLGRDCTGIVVDIGRNVNRLEVGDEVWLTAPFWASGTMTEYIVAPEYKVSLKPKTIGFEGAASLPYSGSTVLSVLRKIDITSQNANTKTVFVHGGCSAMGCILVQILIAWGAKVTTSCYSRATPVAKALGVNDIIGLSPLPTNDHYFTEKNYSLLRQELHCREKFDAIVTTTTCELTNQELLEFCKSSGKLASTLPQLLRSDTSIFPMRSIYSLYFQVHGYMQKIFIGTINGFGEDAVCHHTLDELRSLVESGKVQTVVDRVFQPYDIEHAFNHIESVDSIGSTVITFR